MKVNLNGVSETLMIPFYARVYGSKNYKDIFYDKISLEIYENIEYNFKKFSKAKMSIYGCLSRGIILDREVKNFLNKAPNSVCINLGCGFDTRFNRIDNDKIKWYGIDFSEVIDLRNRIFPSSNNREKYIAANVLEENTYIEISNDIKENENILIIIEGLLIYFTKEEIKKLFSILNTKFPKATILAEFSRPFTVKNQKYHDSVSKTNATFKWGIKNSKDIEKLCPNIEFITEWNLTKEMKVFSPIFISLISPILYKVNNSIVKLKFK